jgi:hypothetical protein
MQELSRLYISLHDLQMNEYFRVASIEIRSRTRYLPNAIQYKVAERNTESFLRVNVCANATGSAVIECISIWAAGY